MTATSIVLPVLLLLSLLGSGAMAGLFLAFSVAVMPALGAVPRHEGMAVMQRINVVIVRPLFLVVFVGTAVVAVAALVLALVPASGTAGPVAAWTAVGTTLYVLGSVVLTGVYHVPRNDRLDAADPATEDGLAVWETYLREWTRWNHVRAAGCTLATAAFAVAARAG